MDITSIKHAEPVSTSGTISDLYRQWIAVRNEEWRSLSQADLDTRHATYLDLQARLTELAPTTAADLAMQFIAETDDGESDERDSFFDRVRTLANQAVA